MHGDYEDVYRVRPMCVNGSWFYRVAVKGDSGAVLFRFFRSKRAAENFTMLYSFSHCPKTVVKLSCMVGGIVGSKEDEPGEEDRTNSF